MARLASQRAPGVMLSVSPTLGLQAYSTQMLVSQTQVLERLNSAIFLIKTLTSCVCLWCRCVCLGMTVAVRGQVWGSFLSFLAETGPVVFLCCVFQYSWPESFWDVLLSLLCLSL